MNIEQLRRDLRCIHYLSSEDIDKIVALFVKKHETKTIDDFVEVAKGIENRDYIRELEENTYSPMLYDKRNHKNYYLSKELLTALMKERV